MSRWPARAAYAALTAAGAHHAARWWHRRQLLIIVYHGVSAHPPPDDVPGWHLVTITELQRQIAWLARHFRVLPLDDAVQMLARGELPDHAACVTFDDGYRNNFELAYPVLRGHGVPATIYLATGLIGTERCLWTVQLEIAMRRSPVRTLDLSAAGLGVQTMDGLADRVAVARRLMAELKRRSPGERSAILSAVHAQLPDDGTDRTGHFRMMSWEDARLLEDTGLITFGAHTVNHEIVSCLDDHVLESELCESITEVRNRLRRPSITFAYPNGTREDFDERAIRVLRATGLQAAVTTIHGRNAAGADPFRLRRVTIDGYTGFDRFRLLVS